jgi:hypothetical protein
MCDYNITLGYPANRGAFHAGQSLEIFARVAKVQGGCVGTAFWMSLKT